MVAGSKATTLLSRMSWSYPNWSCATRVLMHMHASHFKPYPKRGNLQTQRISVTLELNNASHTTDCLRKDLMATVLLSLMKRPLYSKEIMLHTVQVWRMSEVIMRCILLSYFRICEASSDYDRTPGVFKRSELRRQHQVVVTRSHSRNHYRAPGSQSQLR